MPTVTTVRQFREELLLLDKTIMRFVTNPVFQAANTVDVNLAKKASDDLEQVITKTSQDHSANRRSQTECYKSFVGLTRFRQQ
jgi:hypothetical protein